MKQLIVIADMEGASGIFDANREACRHEELYPQYKLWRAYGRPCITSDVLAVCNAAVDAGIDDILLYDMHFAGCTESNVELDKLPACVRVFDLPNRETLWDRIRGQAAMEPYGIITVGQHARNGEANAYFPHTIHTPPIESFFINGIHVAEIGESVMCFYGVPYIANIGSQRSAGIVARRFLHHGKGQGKALGTPAGRYVPPDIRGGQESAWGLRKQDGLSAFGQICLQAQPDGRPFFRRTGQFPVEGDIRRTKCAVGSP